MTLTIDISPDEEAELSAKSKAEGLSIEQWVRRQALLLATFSFVIQCAFS